MLYLNFCFYVIKSGNDDIFKQWALQKLILLTSI